MSLENFVFEEFLGNIYNMDIKKKKKTPFAFGYSRKKIQHSSSSI